MQKFKGKRGIILSVVALTVCAAVCAYLISAPFIVSAASSGITVVVDAGHGGKDCGVLGTKTGAKESDINLKLAFLVGEHLKGAGIRVVYTRTADIMHTYPGISNNKKRADMFRRGEIINRAKPSAVVSIHMNFYSSPSRRGAQVFFDRSNEGSRALANIIQAGLNEDINREVGRSYSALSAQKYILSCSPYPAVIAECGFLSNPLDEAALLNDAYRARLAGVIAEGIVRFLNFSPSC